MPKQEDAYVDEPLGAGIDLGDADLDDDEYQPLVKPPQGLRVVVETDFVRLKKWDDGGVSITVAAKIVAYLDDAQKAAHAEQHYGSLQAAQFNLPNVRIQSDAQFRRAMQGLNSFRRAFKADKAVVLQALSDAAETYGGDDVGEHGAGHVSVPGQQRDVFHQLHLAAAIPGGYLGTRS